MNVKVDRPKKQQKIASIVLFKLYKNKKKPVKSAIRLYFNDSFSNIASFK